MVRAYVARRWGIPPPLVDEYPAFEIENELELLRIESETNG